jgi:serine/threonine-protein kinase
MPDAKRVQAVFLAALDASSAAERAALLARECGGDAELRQRVEALLSAHEAPDSLLDQPAAAADSGPPLPAVAGVVRALGNGLPPVQGRPADGETVTRADPAAGPEAAVAEAADLPPRYRMEREIARGGMGAVLRGRDTELGREIAVKVLLETHAGRTELVQRFVEEAQITGQLQHPGVAPVYDVGNKDGKRPYFTMKLVKGQTLARYLGQRQDPAEERPRWLKVFESVCQAVAFAHSRSVIHRDLKPANIMVGAFGEVQVMDWGLAKVLSRDGQDRPQPEQEPTSIIATVRSADDSGQTQAGTTLGTPAYMAPEQARGEVDRVDERVDVFGLGALLCEILTGQPPFPGKTSEAMRLAQKADLAGARGRLDGCGADADLVTLAKACLGAEPEERPGHAGEVADRVTAYLVGVQEKLRAAELGQVKERALTMLILVVAASVLLVVTLAIGGYAWVQNQGIQRQVRAAQVVNEALAEAARLQGAAQGPGAEPARWSEALAAVQRAEELLAQCEADSPLPPWIADQRAEALRKRTEIEEQSRQHAADRALLAKLEAIRGGRAEHTDPRRTDNDYAAAFRGAGLDLDAAPAKAAGAWLAARAKTVELTGYLDDWAFVRRLKPVGGDWKRLLEAARAADPDPWRNALRARAAAADDAARAALVKLADDEQALDAQPAASLVLLARLLKIAGKDGKPAARVLRRAWLRFPGDYWVNVELALAKAKPPGSPSLFPRPEETARHLSAAVAVRPTSVMAWINLGTALRRQGKEEEAIAAYRKAIALDPKQALPHSNLGATLSAQCKVEEAVAAFRRALALDPKNAVYHGNLGVALGRQGKREEALTALRQALVLDPKDPGIWTNLGVALGRQGKLAQAVAAYRKALELDPKRSGTCWNLGVILDKQGKADEAIAAYRKALELDPKNVQTCTNLGIALRKQGKLDEAITAFRQAIPHDPRDARVHHHLGLALSAQGKVEEAIAAYRQAIRLDPRNPLTHFNLGNALSRQGKLDEAIAAFRQAIDLDPKDAHARNNLGIVLRKQGKLEEASIAFREVIQLDPASGLAHSNLGSVLLQQGKWAEAASAYRKAIDLGHKEGAGARLGQWQRMAAQAPKLPAYVAGELRPQSNEDALALAELCRFRRLYRASVRFCGDAFAGDAHLADDLKAGHRYNAGCCAALAACGKGEDAARLDDQERAKLRTQAVDWLRRDLAGWSKQLGAGKPQDRQVVAAMMLYWQKDGNLAGLRDECAVANLPVEQRQACQKLWADVAALSHRARQKTK